VRAWGNFEKLPYETAFGEDIVTIPLLTNSAIHLWSLCQSLKRNVNDPRLVLPLKEVYGFKVKEISQILQQSDAMVKYHLHVSRNKMIEVFDTAAL
jgi:hypothetical protein